MTTTWMQRQRKMGEVIGDETSDVTKIGMNDCQLLRPLPLPQPLPLHHHLSTTQ
jgi:hypothetical protein